MSLVQAVMIMEALQGHERFGIQPAVCVESGPPSPDPTAPFPFWKPRRRPPSFSGRSGSEKSFLQDSGTPGKVALK